MQHLRIVIVVRFAAAATARAAEPLRTPGAFGARSRNRRRFSCWPRATPAGRSRPRASREAAQAGPRSDSIWEGLLIGAAAGGVGGYVWARQICGGTDDTECFVISAPVGIAGGAGIGAVVGAVVDKLHK